MPAAVRSILVFLAVLALAYFVGREQHWIPPQHDPLAPLDLGDPPGLATGWKLSRLRDDPASCTAALDNSNLRFALEPDREMGGFCAFRNVVSLQRTEIPLSGGLRVTCPLAAGLQLWLREVVQPAARRYLEAEVTRVDHLGSYACRRVYGRESGRPSQHATANAVDIGGFRLSDGRRISVLAGWEGAPDEQAFLREVRDGACSLMRGVLGPDYNAAHRDHFHLDMGPYSLCR